MPDWGSTTKQSDAEQNSRGTDEQTGLPTGGTLIKMVAPSGRLGIVFKGEIGVLGHTVHLLRSGSPMATQLQPGDIIVRVDEVDTTQFDHEEIREVLSQRAFSERKLTCLRPRRV